MCTYTVHKQCAVRAVEKCKWTSLETIANQERLNEDNDPVRFHSLHFHVRLHLNQFSISSEVCCKTWQTIVDERSLLISAR